MDLFADIDLVSGAAWHDGARRGRQALPWRTPRLMEAGEHRVPRPGQALDDLPLARDLSGVAR